MNNVSMSVLLIISSALIGNFVIYGLARRKKDCQSIFGNPCPDG